MTDNDKISRQALLDEINEEIEYGEEHFRPENEQINKGLKIARKLVRTAPAIEAEPVHENPENGNKESEQYCHDCKHNEVCKYYPHNGCDFKEKAEGWIDDESMSNEDMRPDNEVI